MTGKLTETAVK